MHCALNYTANPVKIDLHKYISDNRQLRISAGACVAITLRKEVAVQLELESIFLSGGTFEGKLPREGVDFGGKLPFDGGRFGAKLPPEGVDLGQSYPLRG